MWSLFQDSKLWGVRPSSLLDIQNSYEAYCFDEAISSFGTRITNEIEKIDGKNEKDVARKRQRKLTQLLGMKQEYKSFRQAGKQGTVKR